MIRQICVKNFESHNDSVIDLCEGFNVIRGTSNAGKSALLRALALAAYGEWAGGENKKENKHGPVKVGAKSCNVKVITDKGSVEVEKGSGINKWLLVNDITKKKNELNSPGTKLPQEVFDIIGFGVQNVGGVKLKFNWASQRDKHFLLDEIDGEKTSPSLVAAVIDEVAGLSGGEDLIRLLVTEKGRCERSFNEVLDEKNKIQEELRKFEDVEDEKKLLGNVDDLLKSNEKKMKFVDEAKSLLEESDNLTEKIDEAKNKLSNLAFDEGRVVKTLKDVDRLVNEVSSLASLSEKNKLLDSKISFVEEKSLSLNNQEKLEELTSLVCLSKEKSADLVEFNERVVKNESLIRELNKNKPNDVSSCVNVLKKLEDDTSDVKSMTFVLNKIIKNKSHLDLVTMKHQEANVECDNVLKEYDILLKDIDVCPLCGSMMTEEHKDKMLVEIQ